MKTYDDIKKGDIVLCWWDSYTYTNEPSYYWVRVTAAHSDGNGHWLGVDISGGANAITIVNKRRFIKFFDIDELCAI